MNEEQKYHKIVPYGNLIVNKESYLLLFPRPIKLQETSWEDELDGVRYLVVPADTYNIKHGEPFYRRARHVIVFGDHHIEYISKDTPILVENTGEGDLLGEVYSYE